MTAVFVHGNPETSAIWGPLVAVLGRDDVVLLSPPGFGAPLPDGFGATFLEYRDWLEGELGTIDGPIDLVGHDWGGGHVVNAVMHRPELVRSWVCDVLGLFDEDYVWHDMAQVWQTPDAGEEALDAMMAGGVPGRTELLVSLGFPPDIAAAVAGGLLLAWIADLLTGRRGLGGTALVSGVGLLCGWFLAVRVLAVSTMDSWTWIPWSLAGSVICLVAFFLFRSKR